MTGNFSLSKPIKTIEELPDTQNHVTSEAVSEMLHSGAARALGV